jgi:N4-(beta-N-acetylglucosaminyl)-L-asparaginase
MPSRRDFLGAAAALGAASLVPTPGAEAQQPQPRAGQQQPRPSAARATKTVVVGSANGLRGVKVAYDMIGRGVDTLDAIISGVNITELDADDQSVGVGGLPNAEGVVQLDASCMHGPTKRAGAVGCLEDIATPSLVAKAVMDHTTHVMLVGDDAKRFALSLGFKETQLLTERSRQDWLRWRSRLNSEDHFLDRDRDTPLKFLTGTINMSAVSATGDISSVTTTSGMAYKVPGRVGDSPIVGAGQYCDNGIGAAGSTGLGEANIKACGAFLCVEYMRQGLSPADAAMKTLERIIATTEARLIGADGRPTFDIQFYAVAKDGRYAGVTLYEGAQFAVCDEKGARLETCTPMFRRANTRRD